MQIRPGRTFDSQTFAELTQGVDEAMEPATDATYSYYAFALPGTLTNSPLWKVMRVRTSDSQVRFADGNANYDNLATNLTGLVYS